MIKDATSLPSVSGEVRYSVDYGHPVDYYFYEPEPGTQLYEMYSDPRELPIHDAWPRLDHITLEGEGFELHAFPGIDIDFTDDECVRSKYYPLVIDHVKRHSGAKRVVVFDHTVRSGLPQNEGKQVAEKRPVALGVHCDYTPDSGPLRVRQIVPEDAEDLLKRRVVFYNVWKPLRPVEELPLTLCDPTTVNDGDMMVTKLRYRDRTGEVYSTRYSDSHRWYYFPHMQPTHCLMFKTYESETDGRPRFVPHTAFKDPTSAPDAIQRQSIEVRTMAFF